MDDMIRYNHPGDLNVWFVQYAKDPVPKWAVNIEPHEEEEDCPELAGDGSNYDY